MAQEVAGCLHSLTESRSPGPRGERNATQVVSRRKNRFLVLASSLRTWGIEGPA